MYWHASLHIFPLSVDEGKGEMKEECKKGREWGGGWIVVIRISFSNFMVPKVVFNWNHFEMRLLNLRIIFLFIADFLSSSW